MGAIRRSKTKRRTRDLDLVHSDLRNPKQLAQHKALIPDEDKAGLGQFYCVECAKYFESQNSADHHLTGKRHKRRVRMLQEVPYTQKEADAGVGMGVVGFQEGLAKAAVAEKLREDTIAKPMDVDENNVASPSPRAPEPAATMTIINEDEIM